jgi:hypothetical protein
MHAADKADPSGHREDEPRDRESRGELEIEGDNDDVALAVGVTADGGIAAGGRGGGLLLADGFTEPAESRGLDGYAVLIASQYKNETRE